MLVKSFLRRRECLLSVGSSLLSQTAGYKNFVMNRTLADLEKSCERFCRKPRVQGQKVAIIGAGSDVGQIVSLFLKQQKLVKTVALYDDNPYNNIIGIANDLAHIDTSTSVEAYQGRVYLKEALHNADVALICGGFYLPSMCGVTETDLFFHNMGYVHSCCLACAHFCPTDAIIVIQTPPVDANFALCRHTLKMVNKFKPRQVMGVNSVNVMRAKQIYSVEHETDPNKCNIPIVCGTGMCTRVPVFSASENDYMKYEKLDDLTRLVRGADDLVCQVNGNRQQAFLSIGYSTAICITNIMKGLFEAPTHIDSALIEQVDSEKCYGMEICSTPITIGKGGIVGASIPELNEKEKEWLELSKVHFKEQMNLGLCYAAGDEDLTRHDTEYYNYRPCAVCKPHQREKVEEKKSPCDRVCNYCSSLIGKACKE